MLLFTPLKNKIQSWIDRIFFKGSLEEIAEENEKLRREIIEKEKFKAVATLASGLAHEIRNPLQAIKTFSEYLPKKLDDKDFLLKFSKISADEVNRIDRLIQQILNFSRPSKPVKERCNLGELVLNTLHFLDSKFITGRVHVTPEIPEDLNTEILADPGQIRQALLNIFINAIDAMPQGGKLLIRLQRQHETIVMEISDTGSGIKKEDIPHIFDPFFTRKDHGTGLGLSVTKGIIQEHGGEMSAQSGEGRGTTFTIRLPVGETAL